MNQDAPSAIEELTQKKQKKLIAIIYALQVASVIFGVSFLIAVVLNYVNKSKIDEACLVSHYTWQIRTFWYSITALIAGILVTLLEIYQGAFIPFIGPIAISGTILWVIYRISKGCLFLYEGNDLYQQNN